ncbi:Trytophan aminotransferase [Parasponia andersonii]|uniref:Trytophan aminotransferase n=1 Tax=Parasponia andersonii TaxID=3476 RepID=A0A2P5BV70_PARAD|nr:Trytophan aminotransferase [Parasponia andersonii]
MAKTTKMFKLLLVILVCSVSLNLVFVFKIVNVLGGGDHHYSLELSWTKRDAAEAEYVAAISCSGHGSAYMDGLILDQDGNKEPVCECNACYGGPRCSQFLPSCAADANGGDPYFLEPFWMENAASSGVLVAGWHRMGYSLNFKPFMVMSKELESHIRELHALVGNAVTEGKYIVFGVGSTQLLNAAVHALSPQNSSSPARVVASFPYYPLSKQQTEYFNAVGYKFEGDASLWKNKSDAATMNLIELVTSPNNPDGQLKWAQLQGPNVKAIYDRVYYWPHFTAISAPADEDIMLFSISKLTGHAGTRFGWAVVKDESVFKRMSTYVFLNTQGVSRESQLRALQLIKVVLEEGGKPIFDFGYTTMSNRWKS